MSITPNTNNQDNDWESRLVEYTMGSMPEGEAAAFAKSLQECRDHVMLADQYTELAGWLALTSYASAPPEGHKGRFMQRLAATPYGSGAAVEVADGNSEAPVSLSERAGLRALPPISSAPAPSPEAGTVRDLGEFRERKAGLRLLPALATLAAVLLIAVGLAGWWNAQNQTSDLQSQVAALQAQTRQAQADADKLRTALNIPSNYKPIAVTGQNAAASAAGVAFVDATNNQLTLVTSGLAPLGANEVYELWYLPAGAQPTPVAAGTFTTDASGAARHDAKSDKPLSQYAAIAVTREPAPGGSSPKGPIVMVGQLQTP